jgi:putative hydrolase of HD superfamily
VKLSNRRKKMETPNVHKDHRKSYDKIDSEKLLEYYKLKNLIRFNMSFKHKAETVAEHSYYVALFTKMICEELFMDSYETLRCINYALLHDMPETELSDIPHPVKANNPTIDETVNKMEIEFMKKHFPRDADMFENITFAKEGKKERLHWLVVRMADIVSVLQFADLEVQMGNLGFSEIYGHAFDRYTDIKNEIYKITDVEIKCFEKD